MMQQLRELVGGVPPSLWIDVAALVVMARCLLADARDSGRVGLWSLASQAMALVVAAVWYPTVAALAVDRWPLPFGIARVGAFLVIALVVNLLLGAVTSLLRRDSSSPGVAERLLGVVTGSVRGALSLVLMLAVGQSLPLMGPVHAAIESSTTARILERPVAWVNSLARDALGDAIAESMTAITLRPDPSASVTLPFRREAGPVDTATETRMLDLINLERSRGGLGALQSDDALRGVSRAYAARMLREGFFAHNTPDGSTPLTRAVGAGARFTVVGENLAVAPNVDVAHRGLMNSPGHRANILGERYRRVGVGVVDADWNGKIFVQTFAD
jgi:uncharacterized protein YkwD